MPISDRSSPDFINVANPVTPTLTSSFNPPGGDQWYESEYTPDFERL
jgi:hypothetical protein